MAQTESTYYLLWYQGQKIKPNVLLTASGDTVRYDPAKRTVKVTAKSGAGKNFDGMLAELNRTPQRMQQMMQELSYLPKPILPPLSMAVKSAFTQADEEYRKLLSNVITIPAITISGVSFQRGKGAIVNVADWEDPWEALVQEFRAFITTHSTDNLNNLPEPPRFDFTYCSRCDSTQQTAYRKSMAEFTAALLGKEDMTMLEKARAVSQQAEGLPEEKKRYVQKEVWAVMDFILKRSRTKVERIISRYVDDPERALAVMDVAVSTEREQQIMGFVTHLGVADVSGTFNDFDVTIKSTKEDFSDAVFELTAKVSSIDTRVEARDNHLKSADFFDAGKYPLISFKSTSIKPAGPNAYQLTGDLTMRGITKQVTMDLKYRGTVKNAMNKKQTAGFQLTGSIKRSDYQIGTGFPAPMISDEVRIKAD
ncbi:YceI-like domain protein, partial [Ostertagia ostertagi]